MATVHILVQEMAPPSGHSSKWAVNADKPLDLVTHLSGPFYVTDVTLRMSSHLNYTYWSILCDLEHWPM